MEEKIEFYTAEEVAKVLRLHPYTVRRLCREKKVPAFKFGGQWRFRRVEIDAWSKGGELKRHDNNGKREQSC